MTLPNVIAVPEFARIDEYSGVWCIEPSAFATQWEALARMGPELTAHVIERLAGASGAGEGEGTSPAPRSEVQLVPVKGGKTVAVVPILGTMMKQRASMGGTSTVQTRRSIRSAAANPEVSAILLAVESPGGTVAGTDDLAREVRAARSRKPVYAQIEDLGASAAYWVASQAEQVWANSPTALVGSIGTFLAVFDQKGPVRVFSTGPLKGAGYPGTELTEEQARYFQGIVEGSQAEFDRAVRSGRRMSDKELAAVKSGGVWGASAAQALRLVDGIRPIERTIEALGADAGRRASA